MEEYRKYILALRKCAIEHDNDETPFTHIVVSDLCRDTAKLLERLEQKHTLDKKRKEILEYADDLDVAKEIDDILDIAKGICDKFDKYKSRKTGSEGKNEIQRNI